MILGLFVLLRLYPRQPSSTRTHESHIIPFIDLLYNATITAGAGLAILGLPLYHIVPQGLPQRPLEAHALQPSQVWPHDLWRAVGREIVWCGGQAYSRNPSDEEARILSRTGNWQLHHAETSEAMATIAGDVFGVWPQTIDTITTRLRWIRTTLERLDDLDPEDSLRIDESDLILHLLHNVNNWAASLQILAQPVTDISRDLNQSVQVMKLYAAFIQHRRESPDTEFHKRRLDRFLQHTQYTMKVYNWSLQQFIHAAHNATMLVNHIHAVVQCTASRLCLSQLGSLGKIVHKVGLLHDSMVQAMIHHRNEAAVFWAAVKARLFNDLSEDEMPASECDERRVGDLGWAVDT
ncbi:hypothetical protein QQZ08_011550 [Neonectria magnoliae]|uniref:Uncharacterized protein n=1 Tax=Neonectria magnoliae TaxID=2732573 RepID=A0ABR1H9U6_9HYPO